MALRKKVHVLAIAACVLALAPAADAQLLPGGLPSLPSRLPVVSDVVDGAEDLTTRTARGVRDLAGLDRLKALLRANPRVLEPDDQGRPVVRGEVLAVSPRPEALRRVLDAGFVEARRVRSPDLGIELVTLTPPRGMDARQAVRRLKALDPSGDYDFNHIYAGAGLASTSGLAVAGPTVAGASGARVGLVDGGVDAGHPDFRGVAIEQRGFTKGAPKAGAHGTATASLIAARDYGSAGPGARLLAADVYGVGPTGGSASAIVGALSWMSAAKVPVVNVSLVGPDNGALRAAVKALVGQGVLVVAAVGNDGPAAPPLYPASYPGVIAVTGVDKRGRALPEASANGQVAFAALGAEVRAAAQGGRKASLRGASFAAPVVAGRLARLTASPDPAKARAAVAALARSAKDLGAPGPDRTFGAGEVDAGR
ncbi:peptidase S8 [Caulobacter radicis]|uniref:Peptidase S8 n=1 Tax=Caulobacter radicis TaxID=2172650 RepID=A0A2T9K1K0_9CAUL|nr:peptidase S8 [Caulobacter radicis]